MVNRVSFDESVGYSVKLFASSHRFWLSLLKYIFFNSHLVYLHKINLILCVHKLLITVSFLGLCALFKLTQNSDSIRDTHCC